MKIVTGYASLGDAHQPATLGIIFKKMALAGLRVVELSIYVTYLPTYASVDLTFVTCTLVHPCAKQTTKKTQNKTKQVAVPAVGAIMADWGADVVKIEGPSGDPVRRSVVSKEYARPISLVFEVNNRGKKSVVLDLGTAAGKAAMETLLQSADVFVTNYRQQVLQDLHLTPEEVHARHPHVVIGMISGYGDKGPEKYTPGFDVTAFWARSGLDSTRFPKGGEPPRDILGVGDNTTGLALLSGVLAALRHRDKTGKGQIVKTSLLRSALFANNWATSVELTSSKSTVPRPRSEASNCLQNSYKAKDGRNFWLVQAADKKWPDLCKVSESVKTGFSFLKQEATAQIVQHPEWETDDRFNTVLQRAKNAKPLIAMLDAEFAQQPLSYWYCRE